MLPFKDYLLEYAKKEQSIIAGIGTQKARTVSGNINGKDRNSPFAGNVNAKLYKHKHPLVGRVIEGKADNVPLNSILLSQILQVYNTDADVNGKPKSLGSSGAEIVMQQDNRGNTTGILRKKVKQNGM
jgi:hypothetical protein